MTSLKQAALKPTSMDSVDSDNTLLLNMLNKVAAYLRDHGVSGSSIAITESCFSSIFPTQEELNNLVKFTFECRFGWSERKSVGADTADSGRVQTHNMMSTSTGNANPLSDNLSDSQPGSITDKDGALASNRKRKLNVNADKMIKFFREIRPCARMLGAIQHCVLTTAKPVVRKQVFIHFYDWFKSWVNKMYIETGIVSIYDDSDYSIMRDIVILSVTDIWSAIRKNAAVRLYSVVDLFPISHVELLFQGLVGICTNAKQERAFTYAQHRNTAKNTAAGNAYKSPWQAKEGALLGITAIVKKFRRVQTPSNSPNQSGGSAKRVPIKNTTRAVDDSTNGNTEGNNSNPGQGESLPALTKEASASAKSTDKKKGGKGKLSLQLGNLSFLSTNSFDESNPPLSPTGTRQSFSMLTPVAHRKGDNFGPGTSDHGVEANVSPELKSGIENSRGQQKESRNSDSRNLSPSSHATLTFGKEFVCIGGLPSFIEKEMRRVTYENLGHPQLTVRENATKAFAAFLSRSPSRQTLNAFSDVIGKLAKATEPQVEGGRSADKGDAKPQNFTIPDPYLAEGLLSLCVILAKLRMVPEYYLKQHWHHIFETLNKYLGHTASTVRQMSSTVFKHVAFKGSRSWSHHSSADTQQSPALLLLVLEGLVNTWKVALGKDEMRLEDIEIVEDGVTEQTQLTWQSREGRLLTYELVIDYILSNHANFIATDPSRKIYRRTSSPPSIGSSSGANTYRLQPNADDATSKNQSVDTAFARTQEVHAPKTPLRQSPRATISTTPSLYTSPAVSVPSPSPSPSANPWHSPPKTKKEDERRRSKDNDTISTLPMRSPQSAHNHCQTTNTDSVGKKQRNEPKSLLMSFLEKESGQQAQLSADSTTGDSVANTAIMRVYLQKMILQTKECLADDRFELTRMADQVLPGLVKLLCWIDVRILGTHWLSLGRSMEKKDALACRFISSSLLVAVKYFINLRYVLDSRQRDRHGKSSSRPNSPVSGAGSTVVPPPLGFSDGNETRLPSGNQYRSNPTSPPRVEMGVNQSNTRKRHSSQSTPSPMQTPTSSYTPFTVVFKTKSTTQASKQASKLKGILCDILPMFQRLANRAVTEKLFASTMEGMVILHSLFVQKDESWSYGKNVNDQFVALDLRIPVTEAESIKHASIIVNRVVRIHTIAHPKHPQRAQTAHNRMVAVAAKEKRAQQLDNAAADALSAHIPGLFNRMVLSVGCMNQVLKLIPIVLRWACNRDTIDAKCSLLYAVVDSITKINRYIVDIETQRLAQMAEKEQGGDTIDDFDDDFDEETFEDDDKHHSEITAEQIEEVCLLAVVPLEKLLGTSAEASLLKGALQVVLALAMLGRAESEAKKECLGDSIGSISKNNAKIGLSKAGNLLSRLLPVVAERLRQVAPRSVRLSRTASMLFRGEQSIKLQLMSNEIIDENPGNDSQHLDSSTEDDIGDTDGDTNGGKDAKVKVAIPRDMIGGQNMAIDNIEENEATFNQDVSANLRERSPSSGGSNNGVFEDELSSENDDWDDWDDEDGGDTGNEALSNELGWFVHRLHVVLGGNVSNLFDKADEGFALNRPAGLDKVSNSLGPGLGEEECGLHALGFVSAKDMDVLHWSLQMYNLR